MFLVQINPEAKTTLTCLLFSTEENARVFLQLNLTLAQSSTT